MHSERYIAFFDVDHTILDGSTAGPFGLELFRRGVVGPRDLGVIALWTVRYALGWVGEPQMWVEATNRLVGQRDSEMREACVVAAHRVIGKIFADARRELAGHREGGAHIVLVSAGPRYAVDELGRLLGVDECVTAWANVQDGVIAGLHGVRLLFGEGKRLAVTEVCARLQVDASSCWAYGDSVSDREMLESVGHPVAVNPRSALRRVARAKGWMIVRWR